MPDWMRLADICRRGVSITFFGLIVTCMVLFTSVFAADQAITATAKLTNDESYLPLRITCEQLGFAVVWDADSQSATVQNDVALSNML